MEFLTNEPQSKEQLMLLPHLWNMVWRKRLRLEHMQTVNQTSRRIGFNSAWSGSELWSCFKYSVLKLKNQKHIAVNVLFKGLSNGTTLMQIQSGRTVPLMCEYYVDKSASRIVENLGMYGNLAGPAVSSCVALVVWRLRNIYSSRGFTIYIFFG